MNQVRVVFASAALVAGLLGFGTTTARADVVYDFNYSELVPINGFSFAAGNSTANGGDFVTSGGSGPGGGPGGGPHGPSTTATTTTTLATGHVILSVDSIGNVYYAIVQSLGLNNNAYGATSTGGSSAPYNWSKTHKLSDLTGSDAATLSFTNANGDTVLSFTQDYLDQQLNGGPKGGPSGVSTSSFTSTYSGQDGTAPSGAGVASCASGSGCVLASTSSLAYDLNIYNTAGAYTTNSPTSAAEPGWNNYDIYEGEISAAAFGTSGFGALTVSQIHNSPSNIQGADKTSISCSGGCKFTPTRADPVPEPSSLALLGTGLLGLCFLAQRRRRKG